MSALAGAVDEKMESQERILQSIYDHVLRSVVVRYASNMHERIKTGSISTSEIQTPSSRQEIFPSLYQSKSPEEIQAELDQYATEIPNRPSSRKRKLRQAPSLLLGTRTDMDGFEEEHNKDDEKDDDDDDDDDDEDFKEENADNEDDNDGGVKAKTSIKTPDTPTTIAATTTETTNGALEQPPPGVDIWGRIPPKEPKHPVECVLCGRHVSTTRFASHLEKCMGLSTRPGIPNRSNSAQSTLK